MKYLFNLCFLFSIVSAVAQENNSLQLSDNSVCFNTYPVSLVNLSMNSTNSFSIASLKIGPSLLNKSNYLSLYNSITRLNDMYVVEDNSFSYTKSSNLFENDYRANKIDSFNPYGVNNIESSVFLGGINFLLDKIQH